jgi:hypothetical protein
VGIPSGSSHRNPLPTRAGEREGWRDVRDALSSHPLPSGGLDTSNKKTPAREIPHRTAERSSHGSQVPGIQPTSRPTNGYASRTARRLPHPGVPLLAVHAFVVPVCRVRVRMRRRSPSACVGVCVCVCERAGAHPARQGRAPRPAQRQARRRFPTHVNGAASPTHATPHRGWPWCGVTLS